MIQPVDDNKSELSKAAKSDPRQQLEQEMEELARFDPNHQLVHEYDKQLQVMDNESNAEFIHQYLS